MKSLKKLFLSCAITTIFVIPTIFAMEKDPYLGKPTPPLPFYNDSDTRCCVQNSTLQVLLQIPKICDFLDKTEEAPNDIIKCLKTTRENFKKLCLKHSTNKKIKKYLKKPIIAQKNAEMAHLKEQIISCSKKTSEVLKNADPSNLIIEIFSPIITEEPSPINLIHLIQVFPYEYFLSYPDKKTLLEDYNLIGITFEIKETYIRNKDNEYDYNHFLAIIKHQDHWYLCDDFFRESLKNYKNPLIREFPNGLKDVFCYLSKNNAQRGELYFLKKEQK